MRGLILYKPRKLNEVEKELNIHNIQFRHWYGFGLPRGCPNLDQRRIDLLKKGLPVSIICKYYGCQSGCRYHAQFQNLPSVVLAPTEYIGSNYVNQFKPDIMFIDESIGMFTKYERRTFPTSTRQYLIGEIIKNLKKGINVDTKIDELKSLEFNHLFPNHPYDIVWHPLIYHVFGYSKTTPIVLMDATFEMNLFNPNSAS